MSKNKNIAIKTENVSKTFYVPTEKKDSMKGYFLNPFHKTEKKTFEALKDINFTVKKGEFLGIIGRNGSGKSTLLKLIAGIYMPDKGKITVNGKIIPFLELGVGFSPELSGRENIFLNGTILGMKREYLERKFDEIVDFAEVREFIDMPLKNYSSGMQVRLAFAIAVQADADIYLLDEVLAVGDAAFQQKSIKVFEEMRKQKKTVLYVSHDMRSIRRFCNRVLYLRDKSFYQIGSVKEIIEKYIYEDESDKGNPSKVSVVKLVEKIVEIIDIKTFNKDKDESNVFICRDPLTIRIDYSCREKVVNPVFGIMLKDQKGDIIFGTNTEISKFEIKEISGKGSVFFKISELPLRSGSISLTVAVRKGGTSKYYDWKDSLKSISVSDYRGNEGLVDIDLSIEHKSYGSGNLKIALRRGRTLIKKYGKLDMIKEKKSWDVLFLLDGCRFNTFRKINFLKGKLQKKLSLGSCTTEWLKKTFKPKKYSDIVFVSANPFISKSFFEQENLGIEFHHLEELWDTHWNSTLKTVEPSSVIAKAEEFLSKYPRKKLFLHFIQPHHPFIGNTKIRESGWEASRQQLKDTKGGVGKNVYQMLQEGLVDIDKVLKAYEDNLSLVLSEIEAFLPKLKGKKVIITSDHGDCFGEYEIYAHPEKTYIPELIEIPWFTIDIEKYALYNEQSIIHELKL